MDGFVVGGLQQHAAAKRRGAAGTTQTPVDDDAARRRCEKRNRAQRRRESARPAASNPIGIYGSSSLLHDRSRTACKGIRSWGKQRATGRGSSKRELLQSFQATNGLSSNAPIDTNRNWYDYCIISSA